MSLKLNLSDSGIELKNQSVEYNLILLAFNFFQQDDGFLENNCSIDTSRFNVFIAIKYLRKIFLGHLVFFK